MRGFELITIKYFTIFRISIKYFTIFRSDTVKKAQCGPLLDRKKKGGPRGWGGKFYKIVQKSGPF